MRVQPLDREDPLEEEVATHTSILSWKIPWTEEPGGLTAERLSMSTMSKTRVYLGCISHIVTL